MNADTKIVPRTPHGLAKFIMETLALKGKMFSDGSIYTSIRLVDCLLSDIRKGESSKHMNKNKP